jgi:hypothetical protein
LLCCAWWALRIGNVGQIDTKMMAAFIAAIERDYRVADLLATIDCYYSWPCDRERHPFKPYGRWLTYDLHKWLLRAANEADYRRAVAEGRTERTALLEPPGTCGQTCSSPAMRGRDASSHRARSDIKSLGDTVAVQSRPPVSAEVRAEKVRQAERLRSIGMANEARCVVASTASGIDPLAAIEEPETLAEALGGLPDQWRGLLMRTAGRESDRSTKEAIDDAAGTLRLWWPKMPRSVTGLIDMKVAAWCADHGHNPQSTKVDRRRLLMLLPAIRDDVVGGFPLLGVAARLPG